MMEVVRMSSLLHSPPAWAGHQQDKTKLALVRALHTAIYLVMAAATCVVLYAGITGYRGVWLNGALVLVTIEGVVFVGNGRKCPLTAVAQRYGAEKGYVFDTFLPERLARHTFRFFGTLLAAGLLLIVIRMVLA
jgi:hypothetical protein